MDNIEPLPYNAMPPPPYTAAVPTASNHCPHSDTNAVAIDLPRANAGLMNCVINYYYFYSRTE